MKKAPEWGLKNGVRGLVDGLDECDNEARGTDEKCANRGPRDLAVLFGGVAFVVNVFEFADFAVSWCGPLSEFGASHILVPVGADVGAEFADCFFEVSYCVCDAVESGHDFGVLHG